MAGYLLTDTPLISLVRNSVWIAKKELRLLFYSPVGWGLLIVFSAQSAVIFFATLETNFVQQLFAESNGLTRDIFNGPRASFSEVHQIIYLYIPLLTMGVFAREFQTGSIALLMSSPIRPVEVVVGKFSAIAVFLLLVAMCLFVFVLAAVTSVNLLDISAAAAGVASVYLVAVFYAAIGIFMSSLTRHQVVAAISSLAVLFVFTNSSRWFQSTPYVNELMYWISATQRASAIRNGLLQSGDIAYFLGMTSMFLGLCVLRLRILERNDRFFSHLSVGGLSVVALGAIIGLLSSPVASLYTDVTRGNRQTLAPGATDIVRTIDGEWSIVTYANILDPDGWRGFYRNRIRDRRSFDPYTRFRHQLELDYRSFYSVAHNPSLGAIHGRPEERESARSFALRAGVNFDVVSSWSDVAEDSLIDIEREGYRTIRAVSWKGRTAPIRFFEDQVRRANEEEISAAIKRVVSGAAVIGFTDGNGERRFDRLGGSDYERAFARLSYRFALVNHGFDVETVSLSDGVPEHIDVLVVADPRQPFDSIQLDSLKAYIQEGGNLLLAIDTDTTSSIDNILEYVGFHRGPVIQQQHDDLPQSLVLASYVTEHGLSIQDYLQDPSPVAMPGSVALYPSSSADLFEQAPILVASRTTTNPVAGSSERRKPSLTSSTVGYALQRKLANQTQRLLIFGDADFLSNGEIERTSPSTSNRSLPSNLLYFLSDTKFPVKMSRPAPLDTRFKARRSYIELLRTLVTIGLPGCLIAIGSLALWRRSRMATTEESAFRAGLT